MNNLSNFYYFAVDWAQNSASRYKLPAMLLSTIQNGVLIREFLAREENWEKARLPHGVSHLVQLNNFNCTFEQQRKTLQYLSKLSRQPLETWFLCLASQKLRRTWLESSFEMLETVWEIMEHPSPLIKLEVDTHTIQNSPNRSDEGLTLETSAFKLIAVANLRYQLSLLY